MAVGNRSQYSNFRFLFIVRQMQLIGHEPTAAIDLQPSVRLSICLSSDVFATRRVLPVLWVT